MGRSSDKLYVTFICVMLAVVTFVAFEQVRHNDFIDFDDKEYVTENPQVKVGITLESVKRAFTTIHHGGNWHPLTMLSYMLDCQLFGLDAGWHHMTSLLFHIASTCLLFWVLKSMTGAIWRSAFVAALFAIHPLHVESVAWVAERKDVLSGFLWMLTMAAYIQYTRRQTIGRYLLVFAFLCLGLMAKSMLVTLPFVLLLLDYWPLCRFHPRSPQEHTKESSCCEGPAHPRSGTSAGRLFAEKIPLFILAIAFSIVTLAGQASHEAVIPIEKLSVGMRIANAPVSYVKYIIKIIYPNNLAVFYPHMGDRLPIWQSIISFLALVGISVFLVYTVRRRRYPAVGWLWFLVTLLPVIGLVQVGLQAIADRYTYLPSIGFFIVVAWGSAELLCKWRFPKIGVGVLAAVVLAMLLLCTRIQVGYWNNGVTLFEHALEVTEDNSVIHFSLANTFRVQGNPEKAIYHYQEALRIQPNDYRTCTNLGNMLQSQGKYDEATSYYYKALDVQPDLAEVHNNLGAVMLKQGNSDKAIRCYQRALQIDPEFADSIFNLGSVMLRQGKIDDAAECFLKFVQIKPDFAAAHYELANILSAQKKYDDAIRHYKKALKVEPENSTFHCRLGLTMKLHGKISSSIDHYRKALKLNPDNLGAMNNLAWIYATYEDERIRNGAEAVRLAHRACELTGYRQGACVDTLCAAYAEAGRFDEAVKTAQKLLDWAESEGQKDLIEKIGNRLRLYKAGRAYRERKQDGIKK